MERKVSVPGCEAVIPVICRLLALLVQMAAFLRIAIVLLELFITALTVLHHRLVKKIAGSIGWRQRVWQSLEAGSQATPLHSGDPLGQVAFLGCSLFDAGDYPLVDAGRHSRFHGPCRTGVRRRYIPSLISSTTSSWSSNLIPSFSGQVGFDMAAGLVTIARSRSQSTFCL